MAVNITRILIETIVRIALREIREAPERSARNLVDLALNFSQGRAQIQFFQSAQRLLCSPRGAYGRLVRSLAANVEPERLLQFGMNIGYNSCTSGARRIREVEAAEGFSVPWALFLEIDGRLPPGLRQRYDALLRQGQELGIHTWFIRADEPAGWLRELLARHGDCAFALLCEADAADGALIADLAGLKHVLFSVSLGARTGEVCAELRRRQLLYAVHKRYADGDVADIVNDRLLSETQALGAPLTLLIPDESCAAAGRERVYRYALRKRAEPQFPTILWDVFRDTLEINAIVSADGCAAGFRADGSFYRLPDRQPCGGNLFRDPLRSILSDGSKR